MQCTTGSDWPHKAGTPKPVSGGHQVGIILSFAIGGHSWLYRAGSTIDYEFNESALLILSRSLVRPAPRHPVRSPLAEQPSAVGIRARVVGYRGSSERAG